MNNQCVVFALLGRRTLDDNSTLPPMGIMSIAAWIRSRLPGLEIHLLNQREENCPTETIARRIIDFKPDVVGLSALTNSALAMARVVELVNSSCPGVTTIIGGPHVAAVGGQEALKLIPADAAVDGEGEMSAELFVRARLEKGGLNSIPGLAWRDKNGEIIRNPGETPVVENMDDIPFPAYDLIDLRKYWKLESMGVAAPGPYAVLSTSRGCPYDCNWCHNISGRKYRAQSATRVVEDMERLHREYGAECFEIVDDVFNLNKRRMMEFSELIRQKDLKINFGFPNGIRTDILTDEVVSALVSAGMNSASYALESGSPRIQKLCGKRLDLEGFIRGVELCARHKVYGRGFAMMGHPTENEADLQMTTNILCDSPLHLCLVFTVTPFPGTELYRIALEKFPDKMKSLSYEGANYHTIDINLSDVPDNALKAHINSTYRRFYLSSSRLARIVRDIPNKKRLYGGVYHVGMRMLRGLVHN
jgi:radical SAM superfamily enzyme YgiQ (UPF0313 family)